MSPSYSLYSPAGHNFFFLSFLNSSQKKKEKKIILVRGLYIYMLHRSICLLSKIINITGTSKKKKKINLLKKKKLEIRLNINCLFWYVVVNFRIITLEVPLVFCFRFLKQWAPSGENVFEFFCQEIFKKKENLYFGFENKLKKN